LAGTRVSPPETSDKRKKQRKDFEQGLKLNNDLRLMIDIHLLYLQMQIKEMRPTASRHPPKYCLIITCENPAGARTSKLRSMRLDVQAMKKTFAGVVDRYVSAICLPREASISLRKRFRITHRRSGAVKEAAPPVCV